MNGIRVIYYVLFAMLVAWGSVHADALSRRNAQGNKLYQQEKYGDAAMKYLDAQLEAPKLAELNFNVGNANYKMKKYDKALEYFTKAAQTTDTRVEQKVRYNMGNCLYKLGDEEVTAGKQEGLQKYTQAIEAYKRALDLNPNDADAKYNLEYVRRKLKDLSQRQQQPQQQQQQQQKQDQQQQQNKENQQKADSTQQQQQQQQRKPGEMSKEEAQRLLDAFKDSEKDAKKKQEIRRPGRMMTEKDW